MGHFAGISVTMPSLMGVIVRHHVAVVAHLAEEVRHLGVGHRATAVVDQEVLLRHVSDVVAGLVEPAT